MKKKNAINILSFIEEYYLQEKPLPPFMLNFILYVIIRAKIVQCDLGIRLGKESCISLSDGRTLI